MNVSELILEGERVVFTYERKGALGSTDLYITNRKSIVLHRGAAGGSGLGVMFHDRLAGAHLVCKTYGALKRVGKWLLALGLLTIALWLLIEAAKSSELISSYIVFVKDFTYLRNAGAVLLLGSVLFFLVYKGYRPHRLVLDGGGTSIETPKMPEEKIEEVIRLLTSYRESHTDQPSEEKTFLSFDMPSEE